MNQLTYKNKKTCITIIYMSCLQKALLIQYRHMTTQSNVNFYVFYVFMTKYETEVVCDKSMVVS